MSASKRPTCVLLVGFVLFGCEVTNKDEEQPATPIEADDAADVLAKQICAQLFDCSCAAGYADEASCIEFLGADIQAAIDAGDSWDADCAGQLAKVMRDWQCLGQTMASHEASFDPRMCPVLKGNKPQGTDCYTTALGDECEPGLLCLTGICVPAPTLPVPVGQSCDYEWEILPCESGSYCDWDSTYQNRICQDIPEAGDSCNDDYLCGPAAADLYCDAGTCKQAPGADEPCFEGFLCGPGLYCDGGLEFTCQPRRELGQGCGADSVCPVDASCVNNICEANSAAVCFVPNWF